MAALALTALNEPPACSSPPDTARADTLPFIPKPSAASLIRSEALGPTTWMPSTRSSAASGGSNLGPSNPALREAVDVQAPGDEAGARARINSMTRPPEVKGIEGGLPVYEPLRPSSEAREWLSLDDPWATLERGGLMRYDAAKRAWERRGLIVGEAADTVDKRGRRIPAMRQACFTYP